MSSVWTRLVNVGGLVTGVLAVSNGGTGISSFGSGIATWLGTPSSANLAAALTDETGSGSAVFSTTPTLVTPVLGVATATSINKMLITAPATSSTLTIADGKTLTDSNTLTFTGTDGSSVAFGAGGTVVYGGATFGQVRLDTCNGYGSSGTKVRKFTNTATSGTSISLNTPTDANTNGAVMTINDTGIYAMSYTEDLNTGDFFGIANLATATTAQTTSVTNLTVSQRLSLGDTGGNDIPQTTAITLLLSSGTVVRAQTNGATAGAATDRCQFTIIRIL